MPSRQVEESVSKFWFIALNSKWATEHCSSDGLDVIKIQFK